MNDEQISALMDDALPAPGQAAALDELLAQPAAKATWTRYHLIGDALRADGPATPVAKRLPDNVVPLVPRQAPRRSLVGLGLAAAVAMVAVAINSHSPAHAPNPVAGGVEPVPAQVTFEGELATDDNEQLRGYMINFNEQRARQGTPGVHPYVHTVGYDAP